MQKLTTIMQLLPQALEYRYEEISIGRSGNSVYRVVNPTKPALFLKVSSGDDAWELKVEHDCLNWLASRTAVPKVLEFGNQEGLAFLLTEALPGTNAAEAPERLWLRISQRLALHLHQLHSLDPEECPFDRNLDRVIPIAAKRAAAGHVDESDFDPERTGSTALELLDSLYRERPQSEEIVVAHGDACLPNAIFKSNSFSAFVDCGRCGRADRHQDLALAHRSIESNFGHRLAEGFLNAYGLEYIDTRKLSYYRLLDEFF